MQRLLFLFCMMVALPLMAQQAGPQSARARIISQLNRHNAITNAKRLAHHTVAPLNKVSREVVGANEMHTLNVSGKGVVLCIVDVGIDFNHKAFIDSTGVSHVKRAMIYPSEKNDTLWNETHTDWRWNYTLAQTAEEIARLTTDTQNNDHGTHTSASAGGARRKVGSENAEFYGMAPDADLFLVGNPSMNDEYTVDAFFNAKEYARSVGKPLVCSYSIGNTFMPLDTLEYWPQALKRLTEDGNAKGMAICVSAGNSGSEGDKLSLDWDFADSNSQLVRKTVLGHSEILDGKMHYDNCYSLFYDLTDRDFEWQLSIMDANKDTVVWQSEKYSTTEEYEGDLMVGTPFEGCGMVYASSGKDPDNHLKCAYIQSVNFQLPYRDATDTQAADTCYVLAVTIFGERGGYVSGKGYPNSQYGVGFSAGTKYMSGYEEGHPMNALNSYCANPWCVSVGSSNGEDPSAGYSSFSSYGYDFYGNAYPEVLAPGENIISAYNRYHTNPASLTVHPFKKMTGTSMSTPITAGVIACWMQENPDLTMRQIHEVIAKTSYLNPSHTQSAPDVSKYGHGILQGKDGWDMVRDLKPSALVEAVSKLREDAETYNLNGLRIIGGKGLLIHGGKKIIVD